MNIYNEDGRLESQTDSLNHKTTYSYEYLSDGTIITSITDPLENKTIHHTNNQYEFVKNQNPLNQSSLYDYTGHEVTRITDPKSQISVICTGILRTK